MGLQRRPLVYLVVLATAVIVCSAIRWSFDHPYGTSWDEAQYLNDILIDCQRLKSGLLLKLAGRLLIKSHLRPPAHRLLALPFVVLLGDKAPLIRLSTVICFIFSAWYVYRSARRIASPAGGAIAALIFSLSPIVVSASMWFSTEGPLYLATAALIYYVIASLTGINPGRHWIGLGVAAGVGLLAKASFLLIAGPVCLYWFGVARLQDRYRHTLGTLARAVTLAIGIAGPWWVLNFKGAATGAGEARSFLRNSLGSPGLSTWVRWLTTVAQSLLGHGITTLLLTIVIIYIICLRRRRGGLTPTDRLVIGACGCAGLPLIIVQLSGTNDLLRHISPVVIPLAVAAGIIADRTRWASNSTSVAVISVLCSGQLIMLTFPAWYPNRAPVNPGLVNGWLPWTVMSRRDQWNWQPVWAASNACGVLSPKIAYLGYGSGFDGPHIEQPFAAQGAETRQTTIEFPSVRWLWRYEEGPLNWGEVMAAAEKSDIVLTAPYYRDMTVTVDQDNAHNAEFADRLSRDPMFHRPLRVTMGRFSPIEVAIFANTSLPCKFVGAAFLR